MDIQKIYKERFLLEKEYGGGDKPINKTQPLVSVCVITYQHIHLIKDCLEGILMQETTFPFEIIIGEDESTDGTREICIDYANKYPDRIRLFLRNRKTSQLFDEHGKYICRFNGKWNRESARGKYIALCEGDDYWIDPLKLQKQVEILEADDSLIACFTNAMVKNEITNEEKLYSSKLREGLVPKETILLKGGGIYPTASLVFKRHNWDNLKFLSLNSLPGDVVLIYGLLAEGDIWFLNEVTCVYRRWIGGVYSRINYNPKMIALKNIGEIEGYMEFDRLTNFKYHKALKNKISKLCLGIISHLNIRKSYKYFHRVTVRHYLFFLLRKLKLKQ